jgi:5-methylcytosine-specific restriction endonuclease McrA
MGINLYRRKLYGIDELVKKKEQIAYRIIEGDFRSKIPFNVTEKRIYKIFKVKGKRYERHKIIDSNFTYADSQWIKHLFEHRCFNCGSKKNLQIDHHMPLSLGYGLKTDEKYNAVLLCKRCNNQKSSLLPTKFYTPSQLKVLETTYDIQTHKDRYTDGYKNIDIENVIDLYERSLKDKILLYLDYLDYLWNHKKISKYRLKKGSFYKVYYIKDRELQIIYGKIKYNFFLGKIDIDDLKVKLRDIKGVILWR